MAFLMLMFPKETSFSSVADKVQQQSELVGGLEHFLFFHIVGIIIPTDELIFFRGVVQPPTRETAGALRAVRLANVYLWAVVPLKARNLADVSTDCWVLWVPTLGQKSWETQTFRTPEFTKRKISLAGAISTAG